MKEETLGFLTRVRTNFQDNRVLHSMTLIQVKTDEDIEEEKLIHLFKQSHFIPTHMTSSDVSTPDSIRATPMEVLTRATLTKNKDLNLGGLTGYSYNKFISVTIKNGLITEFSYTPEDEIKDKIIKENARYKEEFIKNLK